MEAANDDRAQEKRILAFAQKTVTEVHKQALAAGVGDPADVLCVLGTMYALAAFWAVNEAGLYESREAALEAQHKLVSTMYDSFKFKPRKLDA